MKMTLTDELASRCHAAIARVAVGSDDQVARRHLLRVLGHPTAGPVAWEHDVAAACDSPTAQAWRDRELRRAVDPDLGPGVRTVLLRYSDGFADVIVVAGRPGAAEVSPSAAAPRWAQGSNEGDGSVHWYDFEIPAADSVELLASLGLVLACYSGGERISIGVLDRLTPVQFEVNPQWSVGEYLAAVREAFLGTDPPVHDEPTTPDAGLAVVCGPGLVTFRPFLTPPWPVSFAFDGSKGSCAYRSNVVSPAVVVQFAHHLATAAGNLMTAKPDVPLGEVDLLGPAQRLAIARLGGLGRPLPGEEGLIHHAVAEQAVRQPDSVAVCLGSDQFTYRELDERANRVAQALRRRGIAAGSRVGVCLDRSIDLVAVLLGVLKSGAAYVPMDPRYPAQRLEFLAGDAEVEAVVCGPRPVVEGVRTLTLDTLMDGDVSALEPDSPGSVITPDDVAYVIYTSGSTGVPKGVPVAHKNVTRLLAATRKEFGLGPADVWSQSHSVSFDFSVWEIWGCLMTGGRLVIVPDLTRMAPDEFAALLEHQHVTVLNQTPSAFSQLLEVDRQTPLSAPIRLVIFGGEPLDTTMLLPWLDRHTERSCRLVNMFGITETTVHVTAQTLGRAEVLRGCRSVGRPLAGWHVYVMDSRGRMVPPGVTGEIFVGGCGVAGRYLNRPELTASRFLPDPYAPGLMYRSGDRGRLLADGRLEHLGRLDSQVQLRGYRIELGEIRARLLDVAGVRAAAVVLHSDPANPLTAQLDAYVVGEADPSEVRRNLARFLPDYMVPATVTVLPALPLTANGKIDVKRLPAPGARPSMLPAPGASLEDTVRAAWQEVFGFGIEPDDDFFAVGGTSLVAIRLLAALRDAGLPELTLPQLYRNRSIRRLSTLLSEVLGEASAG